MGNDIKPKIRRISFPVIRWWHFKCELCRNLWDIECVDNWSPKSVLCPRCCSTNLQYCLGYSDEEYDHFGSCGDEWPLEFCTHCNPNRKYVVTTL